ncbi:MAG: family 10 glycosylhydrolase [Phycisphaerales bacterium]
MKRLGQIALVLILGVLFAQPAQAAKREEQVRAIWVTRWDYKSPADVKKIIANCAAMRFNVILFQVRGNGTVFYPSQIEPWAWELTSEGPETTGKDPGWDPLKLAIKEAHKRGLELHAYANVFPAWLSKKYPPKDSGQLWWEHPDWFMCDAAGNRMVPRDKELDEGVKRDWYSFISPGVPAVQDYLADLFGELAKNYDIDGLHYDYIRYPREIHEVAPGYEEREKKLGNWSFDPVSLARFSKETGVAAPDLDLEKWIEWRAAQITEMTRKVSERVREVRPNIIISAAVMADPDDAYRTKMQDYVTWMEKGYLDAAITMNYTGDNELFTKRCNALLERRPERGWIVPGMSLGGKAEKIREQVGITQELKTDGFAGFAYSYLFDRDNGHIAKPLAEELADGLMPGKADTPWGKKR